MSFPPFLLKQWKTRRLEEGLQTWYNEINHFSETVG